MTMNDYGTVGEPAPSGLVTSGGAGGDVSQSNRGDKARINTAAFLEALGLSPTQGWKVVGLPTQKLDNQGEKIKGNYTVTANGPNGEVRTITLVPQSQADIDAGKPLDQIDWNPTGVEQSVKPNEPTAANNPSYVQAQVDKAKADQAKAEQDLRDLQASQAQRDKNLKDTGYAVTDQERATIENTARSQNLTQQQIDNQLKIASDNNKNSQTSNDIAMINAQTNATSAAANTRIQEARLGIEQAGSDQAAQRLAVEAATAAASREHQTIADTQNQARIDIERLTQQQANQIQQATLTQRTGEGAETARHNLVAEQQQAAATQQAAESARMQTAQKAAESTLTGVNNAAQVGQGLLQNRVTAATGALNTVVGQMGSGNLGGGVALPAGWGSRLLGGLQEWVTGLGGGQPVYDSAAAMVNQANPAVSGNPTLAQQAYAALRGYMDLYKAQTGQEHPLEAQQRQQALAVNAPTTAQTNVGVQQNLATQQAAAAQGSNPQSTVALNARGYADTPEGRAQYAAGQPPSGAGSLVVLQAPVTAPGMTTPYYQQQFGSAVGQPATGPVVGGNTGAPWGVPQPMQPLPLPTAPIQAPVTA